jgi:microcystin-dependent protein
MSDPIFKRIFNLVYPVGSIYMSVNNTSPATLFGGTWVQLKDRFLLGAGDSYSNGKTGGAATHTLTWDQMPVHYHGIQSAGSHSHDQYVTANPGTGGINGRADYAGDFSGLSKYYQGTDTGSSGSHTHGCDNAGKGEAHNNMPPYLVVYMWKRTA